MTKRRSPRYLGMTVPQIAILAGMFLATCCIVIGGFWLLTRVETPPAEVIVVPPSATPGPTFTPAPTFTPSLTPTATPVPYAALIPSDWKSFTTAKVPGLEIWLPPSYVAMTDKEIKSAMPGADPDQLATIVLGAKDSASAQYGDLTNVLIHSEPMQAADIDALLDDRLKQFNRYLSLMERKPFELGDYPARRLTYEVRRSSNIGAQVTYVVQIKNTVWYIDFATPYNALFIFQPMFDQSALTFRIVPPTPTPPPTATKPPITNTPLP